MSLIETQEVTNELNTQKPEKKDKAKTWNPILLEINRVKSNLSPIQKIRFNIFGVIKIEDDKYLKKCPDCGEIYLTDDPNDYYCPES